jgi:hypothetical protein
MLEGLAKLYAGMHNRKKFEKIKIQFKLLEDVFGAIDYYNVFAKEFAINKKIPVAVTAYMQAQAREKIQSLNELLIEKEWLGTNSKRINKIQKILNEADWLNAKEEIKEIDECYGRSIYEIVEFASATNFHYTNVESDVHELRRKLRWLSIYAQAMQGCIQLSKGSPISKHLKKYLTKKITGSPFNKLPDAGDNKYFLLLEENHFYALSWMIAEMGRLKDEGLRVIAIKEALQQSTSLTDAQAFAKAYAFTGRGQEKLNKILSEADKITKVFIDEQNLEHLVKGHYKAG